MAAVGVAPVPFRVQGVQDWAMYDVDRRVTVAAEQFAQVSGC